MEIILLERIESLGKIGDVVKVKDGYARNYLLPLKKALRATEANKKFFETQRKTIEEKNIAAKGEAEKLAKKIAAAKIVLLRQAGEGGQLYGSVSARDIAAELAKLGHKVDRDQVLLGAPIKDTGLVEVTLRLHGEVSIKLPVNVARTDE
ncbi:MAG TPA: 50S ribosomal protein L9, partial [Sphingomonadales bacterium]|nr:50S ribosomal protein L9 [Sphingomonadales bacterium]